MADAEQLQRIKTDVKRWNHWRQSQPNVTISLEQADLKGADLKGADLSGARLTGANLREANLEFARLENSDLSRANLKKATLTSANLSHANLNSAVISGAKFGNASLAYAKLEGVESRAANFTKADLPNANLSKANFEESIFRSANMSQVEAADARFPFVDAINAKFPGAICTAADFSHCKLNSANLMGANFTSSILRGASLVGAKLAGTDLTQAHLNGADLTNANLTNANLELADLRGAQVSRDTQINGARVENTGIDRFQLERLGDSYGGLTRADLADMFIEDGVVTLRAAYSGFMQWLHLITLALFLFPYLWFVFSQWSIARFVGENDKFFSQADGTMALWEALYSYIYSGGIDWELGPIGYPHWTFYLFVIMLLYNFLRLVLLWKTKSLENYQNASGIRANFSLSMPIFGGRGFKHTDDFLRTSVHLQVERIVGTFSNHSIRNLITWGTLYRMSRVGFYVALGIAIANTVHFFTQEIPIYLS